MLKFLLYLFLIYIIVRFLFGRILGPTIKVKTFHYNTHTHYNNRSEEKPEGTVIIESEKERNNKKNENQLGEYVDYEEVK